jgi:eukaryotic-like serine/threonine-protein kinase
LRLGSEHLRFLRGAAYTSSRMSGIVRGGRVGRYVLVHELGEGGMGTVWLAHPHDAPDQLYAVKTVSAQYAADPRVCAMFVKEATLAALVDHPNVVRLHDVGVHQSVPFYVMEWIDGHSLRDVARTVGETGEPVPAGIAMRIAADLCGGLHAAHELRDENGELLGLVHRDVSPHNVLVTFEGVAKLIDFGVAKARDLASGRESSVCAGLKGKVRYMAPEQALEEPIDRRADLFSVGAILFQLLTGRAPLEGPNELAVINALLSTAPIFVPEDLPEPVQWILRRALARKPEQRFADAAEMQDAIELALVELGEPDSHADVAECLAWIDPRDPDQEVTSLHAAARPPEKTKLIEPQTSMLPRSVLPPPPLPAPSVEPAPLHYQLTGSNVIPARKSSLPDDDPVRRSDPGAWRFVAIGAAFVGLLGLAAALLVGEAAQPKREAPPAPVETAETPAAGATPSPTMTTPIIELGDLDESKPSATPRSRTRRTGAQPAKSGR